MSEEPADEAKPMRSTGSQGVFVTRFEPPQERSRDYEAVALVEDERRRQLSEDAKPMRSTGSQGVFVTRLAATDEALECR